MLSSAALAQERTLVGRAAIVEREATAQFAKEAARTIKIADQVFFAEEITTRADAKTVLEFRDGSTLELGPNSNVLIDKFVFNPVESTSEKSVRITQGLFRYTSSFVAKSSTAEIKTPTATMGAPGRCAMRVRTQASRSVITCASGVRFTTSAISLATSP